MYILQIKDVPKEHEKETYLTLVIATITWGLRWLYWVSLRLRRWRKSKGKREWKRKRVRKRNLPDFGYCHYNMRIGVAELYILQIKEEPKVQEGKREWKRKRVRKRNLPDFSYCHNNMRIEVAVLSNLKIKKVANEQRKKRM